MVLIGNPDVPVIILIIIHSKTGSINFEVQMDQLIHTWRDLAEFIGMVDVADLDSMAVPAGEIRTDLVNFRTVLDEIIDLYDGTAVTPTNTPSAVIDRIRHM